MAAPTYQFANNANTILAAPINTVAVTLQVSAGTGAIFPAPIANQPFLLTLIDSATQLVNEIVLVTNRVGDVLTVIRAQEGTTAKSWLGGDICANLVTAGTVQNMEQIPQAQAAAHNWASDTGGVNSYVGAYSPPITQRIAGMTLRMKISNSNTGPSTLDIGAGPSPWVNPDGSPLGAGALISGGWAEFVDNVTNYQLISSSQQAQSLAGAATTGAFQWRPTSETQTGWIIANATTIGNAASGATQRANSDTANLFAWHWNNFSNTQIPVFTSAGAPTTRGANAAADFAANKSIQVFDKRGKGTIGVDGMGNTITGRLGAVPILFGSVTAPGSFIGENLHTLLTGEMPSHFHSASIFDPSHGHIYSVATFSNVVQGANNFPAATSLASAATSFVGTGVRNNSSNGLDTTYSAGGGSYHNNVEYSDTGYWWIKL